jgi:molybdate transport system ATP-binding protein
MMASDPPGLTVELKHRQGDFTLEAGFSLPERGITALFGPSGAGKTTLINVIAGLIRPAQARITLGGRVLNDSRSGIFLPPHRRRLGYVFQDARLFPHLNVRSNLLFARLIGRAQISTVAFEQIVDLLGLEPLLHRRPRSLSGGERSRVAIGRALLSQPDLLLLDEPLAALDEARRADILPWLERLRDAVALPMLYVSHRSDEVERLADRLILLQRGQVSAAGPLADLRQHLDAPGIVSPRRPPL